MTFPEREEIDEKSTSTSMSTTSSERERQFERKAKDWAKNKAGVVHNVRIVRLRFLSKS